MPEPGFAPEPRKLTPDGELTPYGEAVAEERYLHTWPEPDERPGQDMDLEPFPGGGLV